MWQCARECILQVLILLIALHWQWEMRAKDVCHAQFAQIKTEHVLERHAAAVDLAASHANHATSLTGNTRLLQLLNASQHDCDKNLEAVVKQEEDISRLQQQLERVKADLAKERGSWDSLYGAYTRSSHACMRVEEQI